MGDECMTEFDLFFALLPLYPAREYALLPQVANATGFAANRHCDALALSLWPSRGIHLHGFEIKVCRGDWARELKNPAKAEEIASRCNYWWIVATKGCVKNEELPELWGLMTWDATKKVLHKVKHAKFREAERLDLPFLAAMMRRAQEVVAPDAALIEAHAKGLEEGKKAGAVNRTYEAQDYAKLKANVAAFKKASGVDLTGWKSGRELGEAVEMVINGSVVRNANALRKIATKILEELPEASHA